eukprot:5813641-Pleurochrysis_carterae.AAC.1
MENQSRAVISDVLLLLCINELPGAGMPSPTSDPGSKELGCTRVACTADNCELELQHYSANSSTAQYECRPLPTHSRLHKNAPCRV